MDAAKVAEEIFKRLNLMGYTHLSFDGFRMDLRRCIIEEIGKEAVAEACACVKHWRHDPS